MNYIGTIILVTLMSSAAVAAPNARELEIMRQNAEKRNERYAKDLERRARRFDDVQKQKELLDQARQLREPVDYKYRPNNVTGGFDTYDRYGNRTNQYRPDLNRGYRVYSNHGRYQGRVQRGVTNPSGQSNNVLRQGHPSTWGRKR